MIKYKQSYIIKALCTKWIIILPLLMIAQVQVQANSSTEFAPHSNSQQPQAQPFLQNIQNSTLKSYLQELALYQSTMGGYVQSFGEGIDNFFGDEALTVKKRGSHLNVQLPVRFSGGGEVHSRLNFKLFLDLPKTHKSWKLFVTSVEDEYDNDDKDNLNKKTNSSVESKVNEKQAEQRVGGRYVVGSSKSRLANIDVGLKFMNYIQPNPFIKYRERFKNPLFDDANWLSRTTHTLYHEHEDGFAWELQQVFDHQLNKKELARSQTELTWWKQDREMLINQQFALFQKDTAFRANAYFLNAYWKAKEISAIDFSSVALGMNVREQIYQKWLFFEVEPRVTWYAEDKQISAPNYALKLMLEMHFYK